MRRFALLGLTLGGCLYNPSVDVDQPALDMARGTSRELAVLVDGEPDANYVYWVVDDPRVAYVASALDGEHLLIGAEGEGDTVVHVNTRGQTVDVPIRVGPPAVVQMWIEPSAVETSLGQAVHVRALALDTMFHVRDITRESHWSVRDTSIAILDEAGMMLQPMSEGRTTLHAGFGESATLAPVTVLK